MKKNNIHILLVDDEPTILKTLAICFEDLGFFVSKFQNSREAADSLDQETYDIAFIDLKMSPLDGLELLDEIKQHSPGTTVIIITAHGSIESAVEAINMGAYDYLRKPFGMNELRLCLRRFQERQALKKQKRLRWICTKLQIGQSKMIYGNRHKPISDSSVRENYQERQEKNTTLTLRVVGFAKNILYAHHKEFCGQI